MTPTKIILPFLLFNFLFGVFTVATQNKHEVYPLTVYNLYSRTISNTSYSTILYYDYEDNQHNLIKEIHKYPDFNIRNIIFQLITSFEVNAIKVEQLRCYINAKGKMYLVTVSGDSKALYNGELISVDTLRTL